MSIDPTVAGAIIQGGLGVIFGGGGIAAFFHRRDKRRAREKSVAELRCERVCTSLTTGMDTMLSLLEMAGPENPHPAFTHALTNLRVQVRSAKDYLELD